MVPLKSLGDNFVNAAPSDGRYLRLTVLSRFSELGSLEALLPWHQRPKILDAPLAERISLHYFLAAPPFAIVPFV